ncbi:MAG TPA: type II secretion system F family protein [Nitriliruptorales bacterium]
MRLTTPAARRSDGAGDAVDEARARLAVGAPVEHLDRLPERVARALALARDVGAPALPALAAAVEALDAERARTHAGSVATAQARAVAVALALLPVVGVPGLAVLLDRPLLAFYLSASGRAVAAVGIVLAAAGVALTRVVTARVLRPVPGADDEEVYDLVASALTAGLPPGAAVRALADHLPERAADLRSLALALELGTARTAPARLAPLAAVLTTSAAWGAPAGPALRRLAHDLRADERARVAAAAERLPALLTFPTVLLLLPASLVLVGAPVLASGLDAISGA